MTRRSCATFVVVASITLGATDAHADDKHGGRCVAAAEQGQALRDEGRLLEAQQQFAACGGVDCTPVVRTDCSIWFEEVRRLTPQLFFHAIDAQGADLVDVAVDVDGKPVQARIDAKVGVAVDPGEHVVTFRRGADRVQSSIIAYKEKDSIRVVTMQFKARVVVAEPPHPPPTPPPPNPPSYVWPAVAGGVGVAALGLAGWFQLSGAADVRDARDACGTHCTQDQVDALDRVRTHKELGARISLGVSVVAIGVAIYLLVRPSPSSAALAHGPVVRF